jgi:hypothetical protein
MMPGRRAERVSFLYARCGIRAELEPLCICNAIRLINLRLSLGYVTVEGSIVGGFFAPGGASSSGLWGPLRSLSW